MQDESMLRITRINAIAFAGSFFFSLLAGLLLHNAVLSVAAIPFLTAAAMFGLFYVSLKENLGQ